MRKKAKVRSHVVCFWPCEDGARGVPVGFLADDRRLNTMTGQLTNSAAKQVQDAKLVRSTLVHFEHSALQRIASRIMLDGVKRLDK
jgi:hypothetical protein